MTKDDITRMAQEAGMREGWDGWATGDDPNCMYPECVYTENLERFAALVTAHEREECAKVAEALVPFGPELALQKATAEDCAAAIRARGNP